jgi:chromosome segregation ATPase
VKKTNALNLPYTDSDTEPEKEDESPAIKSPEHSMETAQDCEAFTPKDEGETSRNKKSKKSQKIKELKEVIAQQEVLERVIKARYKSLSENFAKTNAAFEKLARESIKDKKKKKKITKDYNSLWWLAKRLKRKIKKLKEKINTHPDLQVLA